MRGKKGYDEVKERAFYLGDDHDPTDKSCAVKASVEEDRIPLGMICREMRPTYEDRLAKLRSDAKKGGVPSFEELMNLFVPQNHPPKD